MRSNGQFLFRPHPMFAQIENVSASLLLLAWRIVLLPDKQTKGT
ncbi:hypothetical protein [Bacillus manliponensis]|nr:hypothetical protein [Bacillus manliponensis]